jgi:tRNA1(Val) A37 N6-methylase TrmN6
VKENCNFFLKEMQIFLTKIEKAALFVLTEISKAKSVIFRTEMQICYPQKKEKKEMQIC